jgi:hypothetical protein
VVELAQDEALLAIGPNEFGLALARQAGRFLDTLSIEPVIQVPEFPAPEKREALHR